MYALLGFGLLAGLPYVGGLPPVVDALVATFLFLLVSLLLIQECARFPIRPLPDALGLVACLALWYAGDLLMEQHSAVRLLLRALSSMLFLLACVYFGRLLALIVRERNILFPVAIMAGLADFFTVFFGPTGHALHHAPKLVEKLSVAIPKAGSAAGPQGAAGATHVATAGLGDFIFITFFLVGAYRFGLRQKPTFWAIFALVALGMGTVLSLPRMPAAPLLPFVALGFLLANLGAFKFSRTEKLYIGIVTLVIVGALVALALLRRR